MQADAFKNIVSTFSDPGTELLFEGNRVVIQVNGTLMEHTVSASSGDIQVSFNGAIMPASVWITKHLAQLPLLATRLMDSIPKNDYFISPSGTLLVSPEHQRQDTPIESSDASKDIVNMLNGRSPLEASVLYLTSDAGEGKTSLINELTRQQADRFRAGQASWLIVPIPLGGRNFLRFDDITVGALQNRYRFPFLYYNSFLALVRMGVIIPAFDGFEEMFVESSSGEALSAMGILLSALDSKGALIIAARKAYFEFEDLQAQARLYDTIRTDSVGFSKLELHRWDRSHFMDYCNKRGVSNCSAIYDRVSERLNPTHSLLTRPVLVKRLVDYATKCPSLADFLDGIHSSGTDFFSVFVKNIITREAEEKWIDRSGEFASPLLTVNEHCELLSLIALTMWESRVDYLHRDSLEFTTDYFSEAKKKNVHQASQIRERIRGHALLVPSPNANNAIEFDHEEFRLFFLGEAIAEQLCPLNDKARVESLNTLRKGILPRHAQRALIRSMERNSCDRRVELIKFLIQISALDGQASFTQENCTNLIIRLLSELENDGLTISNLAFAADALRDRKLTAIAFDNCYFAPSSLETSKFTDCTFNGCTFSEMRVYNSTEFKNVTFSQCRIDGLRLKDRKIETWDPHIIRTELEKLNVAFEDQAMQVTTSVDDNFKNDDDLEALEKLMRYFMRSTHISDSLIRLKLSARGQPFIDNTIPKLLKSGILLEIQNHGGDGQRRFRLGTNLNTINTSIANAKGSFEKFVLRASER